MSKLQREGERERGGGGGERERERKRNKTYHHVRTSIVMKTNSARTRTCIFVKKLVFSRSRSIVIVKQP